jgi:hypothetical protein
VRNELGVRLGNWLSAEQVKTLVGASNTEKMRGKRDRFAALPCYGISDYAVEANYRTHSPAGSLDLRTDARHHEFVEADSFRRRLFEARTY